MWLFGVHRPGDGTCSGRRLQLRHPYTAQKCGTDKVASAGHVNVSAEQGLCEYVDIAMRTSGSQAQALAVARTVLLTGSR